MLITTNELCKKYADKLVIDHVNMHIPEQSIYGFVGENGSGKTTIMRLLTGLAEPTSGSFTLFGVENKDKRIYEVRQQVSAIVEATSLVPTMTAKDNMKFQELYLGIKQTNEQRDALLKKVHLDEVGNKKVKNFSLGMRQRLGIAMSGITVLISSHILSELEKIASCYGFISHGRLVQEITAEELKDRCRKSVNAKVDDVHKAEEVIKALSIKDYKVYPNGDIKIFEGVKINELMVAFDKKGVNVVAINSADESVEDYYLNLIKEGK